jgi:hypothetical protein
LKPLTSSLHCSFRVELLQNSCNIFPWNMNVMAQSQGMPNCSVTSELARSRYFTLNQLS